MYPHYLFILNNFNDVDHTAPLLFRLLELNAKVTVLSLGVYALDTDPRIIELSKDSGFTISRLRLLENIQRFSSIFAKILREILFNPIVALAYVLRYQFSACIYTWCNPDAKGFQTKLFRAAKVLNIPNVCLPHGQNIFLNFDVNNYLADYFSKNGCWPDFSSRNQFNLYVVQTEHHRNWNIHWGLDPETIVAWGSMRFSKTWIRRHTDFFSPYIGPTIGSNSPLRIVFFIPHWHYNVDVSNTMLLLREIAAVENIALAIKGHTRGDSVDNAENHCLIDRRNVDSNATAASSSLIVWADIVINFGSSIGLEAIVTGKPVINPIFLHTNRTVFDYSNAVYDAFTVPDVMRLIEEIKCGYLGSNDIESRNRLLHNEVYAEKYASDPIEYYAQKLMALIS